jgi:hypothetical protein
MTKILDRTTLGFIRPLIPLLKPAYYSIGMDPNRRYEKACPHSGRTNYKICIATIRKYSIQKAGPYLQPGTIMHHYIIYISLVVKKMHIALLKTRRLEP